ncbi:MAG: SGNH/GDSL hydrolase family protein [Clostridiaceae bacterium]|nr:SGNH/GDSL hydrolase family protein [Oscillospiraceae bacterium]NLO61951.1 SGNH/GDSL hydrolase family protein [Clostridiaceae bacterium]
MNQTIGIWGDSIMRGVVFDPVKCKYSIEKDSAAELFSRQFSIPIRNYSRFGCTAPRAYPAMIKALTGAVPDWILLEFGGNDCDYNWREVSENPSLPHLPNTPVERFGEVFRNMIRAVRKSGVKPVTMSLPPIHAERYFDFITSDNGVDPIGVLEFLGDKQLIYRRQELYSNLVCRIAKESDVPIVDVRSAFLEKEHLADFLCMDGIHPNQKGQRLIQEVFATHYRALTIQRDS